MILIGSPSRTISLRSLSSIVVLIDPVRSQAGTVPIGTG
jgi:hypothetical protein